MVSPEFAAKFRARAGAVGVVPFADFMDLALYDRDVGYYRRKRERVGYGPGTDFFTASTSGPLFGELIVAACTSLLRPADLHHFTFVEIGAEGGRGVLTDGAHPFAAVREIALGDTIEISGRCVVFSNELFDAQPFRRFVFRNTSWHELGVALRDERFAEVELGPVACDFLPARAPEGYLLDAPVAAGVLAEGIAVQPWTGLLLAFDYGKSWRELVEATPAGTARAYFRHTQSNELLAHPGEQDLTCHVCWDWLEAALARHDFYVPPIESQEAFFVHHAGEFIGRTSRLEAAQLSRKKLALMQLLHPSHLGQKFQVLRAIRG